MNQISPTPWTVRKICLFEEDSNAQNGIEVTDAEGNAVCCNQTYYPTALKPENAPIIAAAPEMLLALEVALNGLMWYHDTYPNGVEECDHEAIKIVQAAIKKAKGETT